MATLIALTATTALFAVTTQAGPASAATTGRDLLTGTWYDAEGAGAYLVIANGTVRYGNYRDGVSSENYLSGINGSWRSYTATGSLGESTWQVGCPQSAAAAC